MRKLDYFFRALKWRINLQRTPTMKLRRWDIPEDETSVEPNNESEVNALILKEQHTKTSLLNIATTKVVYTSRSPRMTTEITLTVANIVPPESSHHGQASNILNDATCVNDQATTNHFTLVSHSVRKDETYRACCLNTTTPSYQDIQEWTKL